MQTTLHITGLRCQGAHGAAEGELERQQTFLVDLALTVDISRAATTDSLEDTVDFAALAATIRQVVAGPSRNILETVAVEAARTAFQRFPAVQVLRFTMRKAEPPGLDAAEEAVEVLLSRVGQP